MNAKAIKSATVEALKAELGTLEAVYNRTSIEFKNSKGEVKTCAANLIDRLGRYAGPDDAAIKQSYLDVYFKATHEARKAAEQGCEVRLSAGSSAKAGVRVSSTVKGIEASKAPVADQFAAAQKLARSIHLIRDELDRRNKVEEVKTFNAAAVEALLGKPVAGLVELKVA